ncbi:hypothetical protein M8J77_002728 [Diaphorina citri]|nr:hypothetical protein M8J77_002728 [Diaphorina citri]
MTGSSGIHGKSRKRKMIKLKIPSPITRNQFEYIVKNSATMNLMGNTLTTSNGVLEKALTNVTSNGVLENTLTNVSSKINDEPCDHKTEWNEQRPKMEHDLTDIKPTLDENGHIRAEPTGHVSPKEYASLEPIEHVTFKPTGQFSAKPMEYTSLEPMEHVTLKPTGQFSPMEPCQTSSHSRNSTVPCMGPTIPCVGHSIVPSESDSPSNLSWLLNFKVSSLFENVPARGDSLQSSADPLDPTVPEPDPSQSEVEDRCCPSHAKTHRKPPFTYTELIEQALKEKHQLTVSGIYQWIS